MAAKPHVATASERHAALQSDGVSTLIGTVVNPAGLVHAKTIPLARTASFADPGLGASPVWHVFAIDQAGIVVGAGIGVVGDLRIRIDLDELHPLGEGLAWAPGSFFDQAGSPDPHCSRGTLRRIEQRLEAAGLTALVGHEMEFVLVGPDGARLPSDLWAQYGIAGVLEFEDFVRDVTEAADVSGLAIEQFHPEYGANQFEMSLAPRTPVAAADHLMLAKIIVGRIARKHGIRVSLSPVPFAGSVGSGAHQHISLQREGTPILSGGAGPSGLTSAGESAIAGVLSGLPEAQGVLCGSILSGLRMLPGHWSGASVCWGTENREAAVRFLVGGPGNPHGANVEVKIVDPSANPYLASAVILGLALDGIERSLPLPPEITVDPAELTDDQRKAAGITLLPTEQSDVIDVLAASTLVRGILGDEVVEDVVAVRRYETENFGELSRRRSGAEVPDVLERVVTAVLDGHVATVPLVDHHVHGYWLDTSDRRRFENGLNEANVEPLADFDSAFDTQLGFAVRAHCAPLLGLPRHTSPDEYWARRTAYDGHALARTFLTAAGVSDWLVDNGFDAGTADLTDMAKASGGRVGEIVRLESIAEDAARCDGDYVDEFRRILGERTADALGTKSILAYRGGFIGDLSEPADAEVRAAAARWREAGSTRITDRVLLRFGLYQALRVGKPLQFHVGFGDRDCDLHAANPIHLLDFLRVSGDTPIMLLHCYPYEREAGYLAQAFNNVYVDGGLSINYLGARSSDFVGRLLELRAVPQDPLLV